MVKTTYNAADAKSIALATRHGKHFISASMPGFCAICCGRFQAGEKVFYDPNKEHGKRVAHRQCYEDRLNLTHNTTSETIKT